jgi:hypothetical protein
MPVGGGSTKLWVQIYGPTPGYSQFFEGWDLLPIEPKLEQGYCWALLKVDIV